MEFDMQRYPSQMSPLPPTFIGDGQAPMAPGTDLPPLAGNSIPERCVVLGIGNPLMTDDGIGIHIVRQILAGLMPLPVTGKNVEILDGGTLGYLLIDRLAGSDALIVIDAGNLSADPGEVRTFQDEAMDDFLLGNRTSSVHEVGLIDLLQMMSLKGETPRRRALIAIQPASISWGTELSHAVAPSMAKAGAELINILMTWYGGK
jgi:hydrogenase maturation protease